MGALPLYYTQAMQRPTSLSGSDHAVDAQNDAPRRTPWTIAAK
jgi:hypothetical protein